MTQALSAAFRRWLRRSLLTPGESAVASTGLALAVVLLLGLSASAWWMKHAQQESLVAVREDQLKRAAELIQQLVEPALARDDLAAARRTTVAIGRAANISRGRILLADGRVVAEAHPTAVSLQSLPEELPRGPEIPREVVRRGGMMSITSPMSVAGRGEAVLEVEGTVEVPIPGHLSAVSGIAVIGGVSLILFLLVYRGMRRRFRAMGAIHDALVALREGELEESALLVGRSLGAGAEAWNELLAARSAQRREQSCRAMIEKIGANAAGSDDLRQTCDALWIGLLIVDPDRRIRYLNGSAAVLLHLEAESAAGGDLQELIGHKHILDPVLRILEGSAESVAPVILPDDGTGTVLRVRVRGIDEAGSRHALLLLEDITQLQMADQARNAFVMQATHELRTPLTNIRLSAETAIDDGESDPAMRSQCLNVINQEAMRLERIVSDMLSVSEMEAGAIELHRDDVRLDALLEDLERDYLAQAESKSIKLSFDVTPKLPVFRGDCDKLVLVMNNLLGNALKYTPAGGEVRVRVDATEEELLVEFTDTGIGISEEDQSRIFEKFQRARDARLAGISGSGLGLAIAREVVQLHGGDIEVESVLDQGSTFRLTLPLGTAQGVAA